MPQVPFTPVDYSAQAQSRYTSLFKNKDVFNRYAQTLLSQPIAIQTALGQIYSDFNLDSGYGIQLDIIGALVGQPRGYIPVDVIPYFGCTAGGAPVTGYYPLGTLSNPSVGGYLYSLSDTSAGRLMDDDTYRLVIRGRILANNSHATPEDMIAGLTFLLGVDYGYITEGPGTVVNIKITKSLTPLQTYVIQGVGSGNSLVPAPIGVNVNFL